MSSTSIGRRPTDREGLVGVGRDDLAAVARADGPPDLDRDRALDRANGAVRHAHVDDAGMSAARGVGAVAVVAVDSVAGPRVRRHRMDIPTALAVTEVPV